MLDKLIGDIDRALDNDCYFAALSLALTLPDICGQAAEPAMKCGARYKKWCREYVCKDMKPSDPYGSDMPYLNEEIIYQLRCAFLHQGNPNVGTKGITEERCKVDEFALILDDKGWPDTGISKVAYGRDFKIADRELTIGIRHLCNILVKSAERYYGEHQEKFDFFKYRLIDRRGFSKRWKEEHNDHH